MPRKPRELVDGGIYHVFNRGNDKMVLFRSPGDFLYFLSELRISLEKYPSDLFHYCVMSNHFHLLLRVREGRSLGRVMHRLQLNYARYFVKKYGFAGHVFGQRFHSPRIPEDSYYLQCGRYIERNPVKAGLAERPADYPYSSSRYYCQGGEDALVTPNIFYEGLAGTAEGRRQAYQDFVGQDEPYAALLDSALSHV
jgi:putative transposase